MERTAGTAPGAGSNSKTITKVGGRSATHQFNHCKNKQNKRIYYSNDAKQQLTISASQTNRLLLHPNLLA